MEKSKKLLTNIIYISAFAFIVFIMLLSPLVNDDFSFLSYGLDNIKDIFHFSLYYGNGRLLGNLSSLLLIGSPALLAVEKAIIFFIVIFLTAKFFSHSNKKNSLGLFVFSMLLVLGLSPSVFTEIVTWSTCFQNYVPPVAGLLIIVYLINNSFSSKIEKASLIVIFITALASQLFIEINTVINLGISFLLSFIFIKTKADKSKIRKSLTFFAGSFIGTVVMLLIPRIFIDEKRQEIVGKYRGFHLDSVSDFTSTFSTNFTNIFGNFKESIILVSVVAIVLFITINNSSKSNRYKTFCIFGTIAFPLYIIIFKVSSGFETGLCANIYFFFYTVTFIYFLISILMGILSMEKSFEKSTALFSFPLMFISILPLTIVTPVSFRCFFLHYMFLAMTAMSMASYLLKHDLVHINLKRVLAVSLAILSIHIGFNFYNNKQSANVQIECIEAQLKTNNEYIFVPKITNKYFHNTASYMWGYYYYREKPFDTEFAFVAYDNYKDILKHPNELDYLEGYYIEE